MRNGKTLSIAMVVGLMLTANSIGASAAKTHPFTPPPTMTMGKFSPDPVDVGSDTVAKMKGKAIAPTKVEGESEVTLTWTWKVDRVQIRSDHADSFATAPAGTYDVAITGGGGSDPHATLTLKPKRDGEWKVTVHGTATFTDKAGDTWVGDTELHDATVTAQKVAGAQAGGE